MRKFLFCAIALGMFVAPSRARAQLPLLPTSAAGSTESIDEVRKNYRVHRGPFYVNPAILLQELGVDTNVFNEPSNPKSDFTFTVTPQADIAVPIARRALVKTTLGTDLVYYAKYGKERSVNPEAVVRAEAYAQRLTLFVEESYLNSRQRSNHDLDVRARHLQNDLSGGVSVRFTTKLSAEIARRHMETRFDGDEFVGDQSLEETLNQDTDVWSVVARHRRNVLSTFGLRLEHQRDRFPLSPIRNTDSFRVMPGVEFKPRALITGSAWVGYRNFTPNNPLIPAQRGLVSQLGFSYTLLGSTTFGVTYDRDFHFGYEESSPYFVDNSVGFFVRRAVGGKFDVLGNVARHRYDYQQLPDPTGQVATVSQRVETTYNYGVNLGYRMRVATRVGFGFSYWTRNSTLDPSRGYDGLRLGTTVNYGF